MRYFCVEKIICLDCFWYWFDRFLIFLSLIWKLFRVINWEIRLLLWLGCGLILVRRSVLSGLRIILIRLWKCFDGLDLVLFCNICLVMLNKVWMLVYVIIVEVYLFDCFYVIDISISFFWFFDLLSVILCYGFDFG